MFRSKMAALMTGAAFVVAALAGCGSDNAGGNAGMPTTPTSPPSSAPTTAPTTKPVVSKKVRSDNMVLGPDGFRGLKLGMTKKTAEATGLIAGGTVDDPACISYGLSPLGAGHEGQGVTVSAKRGVVAIDALGTMHTPEGIRLGSTLAELRKAYPALKNHESGYWTPAPGNPKAFYSFDIGDENEVYALSLLADRTKVC